MGFNLGGFSGLSAAYPGYMAGEQSQADLDKSRATADEAQLKLAGADVLGRALTGQMPNQQPMQAPQQPPMPPQGARPMAPPPGQPSVPNGPTSAPQQGTPAPVAPAQPAAGTAGAPPAQGGSGLPEISLQGLVGRILQTSPGIQQNPQVLLAALERAAPILDRQGKDDLAEMKQNFQNKMLDMRKTLADQREEGLTQRAADSNQRKDRNADQRDTREARLAGSTAVRQDQTYQRLDMQRQDLERKINDTGDKQALAQWRAVVDAQHKRATEVIQSNSQISGFTPEDKKALLDEQRQNYEQAIGGMRQRMGGTTPTGGTVPAGAPAQPKVEGRVPQGAPAAAPQVVEPPSGATNVPPAAMLKPNTITTFANGQKWTLGANGQPQQVQ